MELRFCARADHRVTTPNSPIVVGQSPRYINRRHDRQRRAFPAIKEPFKVDSNSNAGRRLTKITARDNTLWPFDEATADHCRVTFVPIAFKDGAWIKKPPPKSPKD